MNDTVASLLAGAIARGGKHPEAFVGLIVGTGTNMAGFFRAERIGKLDESPIATMAVNLESGAFHPPHLTAWDQAVDEVVPATDDAGPVIADGAPYAYGQPTIDDGAQDRPSAHAYDHAQGEAAEETEAALAAAATAHGSPAGARITSNNKYFAVRGAAIQISNLENTIRAPVTAVGFSCGNTC